MGGIIYYSLPSLSLNAHLNGCKRETKFDGTYLWTDRQTDTLTDRPTNRQVYGLKIRWTHRQINRWEKDIQIDRQAGLQARLQAGWLAVRLGDWQIQQTDGWMERQGGGAVGWTNRRTDRQRDSWADR
jgi:hypothetical protein